MVNMTKYYGTLNSSASEHSGVEQPETGEEQHQDEVSGDETSGLVVRHLGRAHWTSGSRKLATRNCPERHHAPISRRIRIYKYICNYRTVATWKDGDNNDNKLNEHDLETGGWVKAVWTQYKKDKLALTVTPLTSALKDRGVEQPEEEEEDDEDHVGRGEVDRLRVDRHGGGLRTDRRILARHQPLTHQGRTRGKDVKRIT
ncbi:unnamed protein product [Danaus chrysippus]|uniref:(African queen) hypothetical protein n=1 Tax=Danaus chrysippus TaxID=151541 RepID=A0A8J2QRK9_9NEOP|nr:unnamed protein product [Danaus chrysippus]